MKRALAFVLLAACSVDGEPEVENVYLEHPGDSIKIDLETCKSQYISAYLPLGSMWIEVHPYSQYVCGVTLGGETENPSYDGGASQQCVFYRYGTISIDVSIGGPAYIDKPSCSDH